MKKARKMINPKRIFNQVHDAVLIAITIFSALGFFIIPFAFETHDLMKVFFAWIFCFAWLSIFYIANREVK